MKRLILTILVAATAATLPAAVIATLDQSTLSGAPGAALTFTGTLQNTGSDEVFITSVTLNQSAELTGDTLPFFLNAGSELTASFSLLPGGVTGSFGLFEILIPPGTLPGTYSLGHDFSLFGGLASGDQDLLASVPFTVDVTGVPEPATWMLSGAALVAFSAVRRSARRSAPKTPNSEGVARGGSPRYRRGCGRADVAEYCSSSPIWPATPWPDLPSTASGTSVLFASGALVAERECANTATGTAQHALLPPQRLPRRTALHPLH